MPRTVEQHLGVAVRGKGVAERLQFGTQGLVVVNFAVEDDGEGSVLVEHRLCAAVGVYDGEPPMPQRGAGIGEVALAIGAAVADQIGHRPHRAFCRHRVMAGGCETDNAAHGSLLFSE